MLYKKIYGFTDLEKKMLFAFANINPLGILICKIFWRKEQISLLYSREIRKFYLANCF